MTPVTAAWVLPVKEKFQAVTKCSILFNFHFTLSLYLCKREFVYTGLKVLHREIISRCCVLFEQ